MYRACLLSFVVAMPIFAANTTLAAESHEHFRMAEPSGSSSEQLYHLTLHESLPASSGATHKGLSYSPSLLALRADEAPPTMEAPARPSTKPAALAAPSSSFVSVTSYGATGNGSTIDGPAIVATMSANPTGTVYFPAGTFLLNNSGVNSFGLTIPTSFHGSLFFAQGALLQCNTSTSSAGQCVSFMNNTAIQVFGMHISYSNTASLPLPRNQVSPNNALFVQASSHLLFTNITIDASPGVGIWNTGSTNLAYSNVFISTTSADGFDFDNCQDGSLRGYWSTNTGDDAVAFRNLIPSGALNGGSVSGFHIRTSHARGIAVIGQVGVSVSDGYIYGTGYSGIAASQDPAVASNIPADTKFSDINIYHAGDGTVSVPAGTLGNKYCIDLGASTHTTIFNVSGHYCGNNGLYAYSETAGAQTGFHGNGIHIDHSNNVGFQASGVSDFHLVNADSTLSAGSGFSFINLADSEITDITSTNDGAYGIYISGANRLIGRNWRASNAAGTNGGLAIEIEAPTGPMSVDGVEVSDSNATATGYKIGGYNIGAFPVVMTGIVNHVADITVHPFAISPSGGAHEVYNLQASGLQSVSNLSDLQSKSVARTNLGLGSVATASGSTINAINYYATAAVTPAAVKAQTCSDQSFAVAGVTTADKIGQIIPPSTIGNVAITGYPSASGTVLLHICNPSLVAVTPPAGIYSFVDFR